MGIPTNVYLYIHTNYLYVSYKSVNVFTLLYDSVSSCVFLICLPDMNTRTLSLFILIFIGSGSYIISLVPDDPSFAFIHLRASVAHLVLQQLD